MEERLDELIDKMYLLREQKRGLQAQIKEVEENIRKTKLSFLQRCNEVGTEYARGSYASATVTEQVVPHIEDWEAVADWIKENDGLYLLHRRVSLGPWRELLNSGVDIPGIEPFTNKDVSLTRLGN